MNLDRYGLLKSNAYYQTPVNKLQEIIVNQKQGFIVDSGASFHLISRKDMTLKEIQGITKSDNPIPLNTANGTVNADLEAWYEEDCSMIM